MCFYIVFLKGSGAGDLEAGLQSRLRVDHELRERPRPTSVPPGTLRRQPAAYGVAFAAQGGVDRADPLLAPRLARPARPGLARPVPVQAGLFALSPQAAPSGGVRTTRPVEDQRGEHSFRARLDCALFFVGVFWGRCSSSSGAFATCGLGHCGWAQEQRYALDTTEK